MIPGDVFLRFFCFQSLQTPGAAQRATRQVPLAPTDGGTTPWPRKAVSFESSRHLGQAVLRTERGNLGYPKISTSCSSSKR